jgi:hypothetical protein
MKPVDGEADLALQKILRAAIEPWKERERSALTRFIFSLLYRQPEAVRELKEHIRDLHLASMESLREHYEQWRRPGDPPTLAEYLASERPERQHRAAMNMLREIIDNIDIGPTINNMYWAAVSVERSDVPLLTSDRPVVMPFGLGSANAYIALPVGPYVLALGSCIAVAEPSRKSIRSAMPSARTRSRAVRTCKGVTFSPVIRRGAKCSIQNASCAAKPKPTSTMSSPGPIAAVLPTSSASPHFSPALRWGSWAPCVAVESCADALIGAGFRAGPGNRRA